MQQQHQDDDVERRLQDGLQIGGPQSIAHQNDAEKPENKVEHSCREEKLWRIDGEAAAAAQRIQADQYQRHQNAVQVQNTEHAPIECELGAVIAIELRIQWFLTLSQLCAVLQLNSE